MSDEKKMRLFNQPIHCNHCGRYLNTVRYFAHKKRDYSDIFCSKPECQQEAQAANGGAAAEGEFADMTKDDLYSLAQELKIKGRSKMDVEELRAAVAEASA